MKAALVEAHFVRFVFPFRFDARNRARFRRLLELINGLDLGRLSERMPLAPPFMHSIGRAADRRVHPVWRAAGEGEPPVTEDFFPYIRRLLGCGDIDGHGADAPHNGLWVLSDHAVNALSGAFGTRGDGLRLRISAAASRRMGRPNASHIRFVVDGAILHLFGTGTGCLELRLQYPEANNSAGGCDVILEANSALSRFTVRDRENPAVDWKPDVGEAGGEGATGSMASLGAMALALCPFLDEAGSDDAIAIPLSWSRLFTYSVLQVSSSGSDRTEWERLAFRICRKYTTDYHPSTAEMKGHVIHPFDDVTHAMSIEGGCAIANTGFGSGNGDGSGPGSFFRTFASRAGASYWLLALLAYQEFETLLWITQEGARDVDYANPGPDDLQWLRQHLETLLEFRHRFRFSSVSRISMHNQIYSRWREVLTLDGLLEEATADSSLTSQYLNRTADERFASHGRRQTALGMFFGGAILLSGLLGMNLREIQDLSVRSWQLWLITLGVAGGSWLLYRWYMRSLEWRPRDGERERTRPRMGGAGAGTGAESTRNGGTQGGRG